MKTEKQIFDMVDRFMETSPNTTDAFAIILALDWVLDRVDTEDIVSELTFDSTDPRGII